MRAFAVLALALPGAAAFASGAWAAQPRPWELGMQPSATPVHERIAAFHDELDIIIFLITIFVLGLLVYVMVRFHHTRNPVPSRTSHNTTIEILWTIVPILILVIIAIPSFKLMYYMDRVPPAAMTIKVTGHQWYWSYAYPDQGGLAFDSNIVPEKDLKPGQPRLLTVDNPLVVPVNTSVRVLVTSTDVIHSWYVPSFGVQEYAVIGRTNQSWFRILHTGTYYGECNQICGINHSHMPIEVVALSKPDFDKWLATAKKQFAATAPVNDVAAHRHDAPAPHVTLVAAATGDGQPARSGTAPAGN